VIILTAKDSLDERVAGVDDCMTKPFALVGYMLTDTPR
jgi:DNA-binding response OmpR family regulator